MDYSRVEGESNFLATATFQKRDCKIKILSTQHVALPSFYSALQTEIAECDTGFYEGISIPSSFPQQYEEIGSLFIRGLQIYPVLAAASGWKVQDLEYPHWSVADMDVVSLHSQAPEETRALFAKFAVTAERIRTAYVENPSATRKFVQESLVFHHSPGEGFCVDGRTEYLLAHVHYNPRSQIGIVYGADHAPRIHAHLEGEGFELEEVVWIEAGRCLERPTRRERAFVYNHLYAE